MDLMKFAEGSSSKRSSSSTCAAGNSAAVSAQARFGAPHKKEDDEAAAAHEAIRKLEEMQISKPAASKPAASKPAPASVSPPPLPPAPPPAEDSQENTADDWRCVTCSVRNSENDGDCTVPGSFRFCPTCGDSRRGVQSECMPPPAMADDWTCSDPSCGEWCSQSFLFCVECGLAAGAPVPPPAGECGGCGEALGDSFKFCPDCGTKRGKWQTWSDCERPPMPLEDADDWTCSKCGDELPGSFVACPECGTRRQ